MITQPKVRLVNMTSLVRAGWYAVLVFAASPLIGDGAVLHYDVSYVVVLCKYGCTKDGDGRITAITNRKASFYIPVFIVYYCVQIVKDPEANLSLVSLF